MPAKILITPRSLTKDGHPQLQRLRAAGFELILCAPGVQPSEQELCALLPGCTGYLAGVEKVSARVLETARDLRVIARNGTGVDNIDLDAAHRRNIAVCPAQGANARGVAELALALLLAACRAVPFSDQAIKAGGWSRRTGLELEGKTLGVIGCGKVGRLVARFALAMDMRVLAYDVIPDPSFSPGPAFRYSEFDEVLARAHMITLHCPPSANGQPLLDAAAFDRMQPGVILVNTARADLIDRPALMLSLQTNRVAAVALDVFDHEPPGDDPLLRHDRVICTPHIGGLTQESIDRAVQSSVEALLNHLTPGGRP